MHKPIQLFLTFREFVLRGFVNSQCPPRIKVHHLDPSMDRSIKIIQQSEQVFEPYHMMFRELKGEKSALYNNVSEMKRKTQKN